jgi:hypothetical protein
MRGLPVRVMWTSEMARRCSALLAILGAVARTAVGREAIVAGGGCGVPRRAASQSIDVDGGCELQSFNSAKQSRRCPPAQSSGPLWRAGDKDWPIRETVLQGQARCTDQQAGTYREHQAALPRQVGAGGLQQLSLPCINSQRRLLASTPTTSPDTRRQQTKLGHERRTEPKLQNLHFTSLTP